MRRTAQGLLTLSAFLAGAAGMGLQSVLLAQLGLACGHSLGGALGPGLFAAGWCVGAWLAGAHRGRDMRALAALMLGAPAVAALATAWLRAAAPTGASVGLGSMAALAVAAIPQGMFLPLQSRAFSRAQGEARVALLYAANLVGALLGAWWIGMETVAAFGRPGAMLAANGAAAFSAALGAVGAALVGKSAPTVAQASTLPIGDRQAAWFAAVVAFWMLGLEWLCLRVAVLWTGSMVGELTRIVACSLFALALGAAVLPRCVHRDARGALEVLAIACVGSTWPLWASDALAWAAKTVTPALQASAWLGRVAEWPTTLTLVVPTLAPLGAVVPVIHRAMRGESGERLGRLFLFEALGALAAGPLLHFVLVPRLGLAPTFGLLALCPAIASGCLVKQRALRAPVAWVFLVCAIVGVFALRSESPALASPKLADPSLTVRALGEDAHFAVSVVDDGVNGERTLLTDTFRAAGSGRDYAYMRVLGHLPVLLARQPDDVAVIALGTGTTLGAVALHDEVDAIDLFELSPTVLGFAPWFVAVNRGALDPDSIAARSRADGGPRVQAHLGDGRRMLPAQQRRYDVITVEPLLPDSPFGVYLYTPEFYDVVRGALKDDGLFAQWVPPHAFPSDVCSAVVDAFAKSFEWRSAWLFGTQLILLGGPRAPRLDPAHFLNLSADLKAALAQLGLDSADGVRARWICDLESWPQSPRALSDEDPWIAWRSRQGEGRTLEWLPRNLELLTARSTPPPWPPSDARDELATAIARLHEARIAIAWREDAVRKGERDARDGLALVEPAFESLSRSVRQDAEIVAFLEEVEFLDAVRRGVGALAAGDARAALRDCVRAVELRPERCDTHLYLATALQRAGQLDAAAAAVRNAEELCPRWRETGVGQRALRLGLQTP